MTARKSHDQLAVYRDALDIELHEFMERFLPGPEDLNAMIRYHFGWVDAHGQPIEAYSGKQLRPLLLLLSNQTAGGDWHAAVPAALSVELLHNFSLVHDDIEDNSPLRRGRQTLWRLWGVANAINAGDVLFSLAHLALWQLTERGVSSAVIVDILAVFEHMCLALTRGQHLDMRFERVASVAVADYLEMVAGKSAALVSASMQMGALVAGLSWKDAEAYAACGHYLGLAFQIQDDILGIWGNPAVTGKSAATDILSKKKTLPVLFGLDQDPALARLYEGELDASRVEEIVAQLNQLGSYDYARELADRYYEQLRNQLEKLPRNSSEAFDLLQSLSFSLLGRTA